MILLLSVGIFLAWVALVAIADFRYRRIPNSLVVAGLICALVSASTGHNPFGNPLLGAIIGAMVAFVGLFPFFAFRMMGAADVKVFVVLGAWCGVIQLFWCWVFATLVAGIHALGIMYLTGASVRSLWQRNGAAFALGGFRGAPYAAFLVIPAAAWLVFQIVTGNLR
ncbi:A24 family peptidase [Burkholderia gladioli]|uniref:A24 family peptidase n=1 Tax=Burkholderia gladioli TaxID=28095 RepID=UPI00163FA88C|nr:prepilin peptidase [Burkholderia gladioli]